MRKERQTQEDPMSGRRAKGRPAPDRLKREDSFPFLWEFDDRQAHPGKHVAGVDEAGRGPLAGPVVAAAVVLDPLAALAALPGLTDSKMLSPGQRDRLFDLIPRHSRSVAVGVIDPETIDRVNILQATLLAMQQAVASLDAVPDLVLVDGLQTPDLPCAAKAIVKGDQRSASIAAASIVAKVTRDRLMQQAHAQFPAYRFDRHKGYGTRFHKAALDVFGPSELHRRSFRPVAEAVDQPAPSKSFTALYQQISEACSGEKLALMPPLIQATSASLPPSEKFLLEQLLQWRREEVKA